MISPHQHSIRIAAAAGFSPVLAVGACSGTSPSGTGPSGGSAVGGVVAASGGASSAAGAIATGGPAAGTTVDTPAAALETHLGSYYSRTIVAEYVGNAGFMQGVTTQMKAYGMGSCYGTAPNYTVTVNNASTLTLIQSGWTQ